MEADVLVHLAAYSEDDGGDDGGGDSDDGGRLAVLQDRYDAVENCDARGGNLPVARRVLACIRRRDVRDAQAEEIAGAGLTDSATFSFLL